MRPVAKRAYDTDGRRKYITKAEGQTFLRFAAFRPKPEALFCLTLYYTGCRISEALALRQSDIDSTLHILRIRTLKKRERIEIRRIPIPSFLAEGLSQLGKDGYQTLWNVSRTSAWRLVKSVMREAGFAGIHATTKGLRHGFGVRCALGQIPLTQIQSWMGHADSSTTAIYLAVRDEEERALIEKTW